VIFINVVCDQCKHAQAVFFEEEEETFGMLLGFLKGLGWRVFGSCHKEMKLLCPKHRDMEKPDDSSAETGGCGCAGSSCSDKAPE
jgi:hypothetical protein